MPESVDSRHLLLIGAGPGVGASVVRRFGREGFRSTLISRGETLEVLRRAGTGTLLFTSGGFGDHPVPALASLSMGKAALRSAATLIAAGVREEGIHAATVTIVGSVVRGTAFDPDNIAELFWTAHTDPTEAWQTEYRFTGA